MDKINIDETKIKEYAKIQINLCALEPNSGEEAIDQLISEIPPNYLTQKDELMMICQLFTQYARNYLVTIRGNVVKLFERIMTPIKKILNNESSFFWTIFGGLFYFKYWFYQEGLITIDQIISSCVKDDSPLVCEYFLPEIIENAPDYFEKEIKFHLTCQYTKEYIEKFKELRLKHFKWLRNSCDCYDPSYREIEQNKLRLSIKTDDIDTFQKILSNTGMSINSSIRESALENFQKYSDKFSLIEFAITFKSIKIIKFLLMNNVEVKEGADFTAVLTHDNEIIHFIESRMKDEFARFSLIDSIASWNYDMVDYSIENYDFDFLEKIDIDSEIDDKALIIFNQTVLSKNFVFFESILLPFLKNNPSFVDRNINSLVMKTFAEYSCFFTEAFLRHPGFDVNFHSVKDDGHSLLSKSAFLKNIKAVEIFLKYKNLKINNNDFLGYTTFQVICLSFPSEKIMKMISVYPGFDINVRDQNLQLTAYDFAVGSSNWIAIEFIQNNFKSFQSGPPFVLFFKCLLSNFLYSLKILLKYYINNYNQDGDSIVHLFKLQFHRFNEYKEEYIDIMKNLIHEIKD